MEKTFSRLKSKLSELEGSLKSNWNQLENLKVYVYNLEKIIQETSNAKDYYYKEYTKYTDYKQALYGLVDGLCGFSAELIELSNDNPHSEKSELLRKINKELADVLKPLGRLDASRDHLDDAKCVDTDPTDQEELNATIAFLKKSGFYCNKSSSTPFDNIKKEYVIYSYQPREFSVDCKLSNDEEEYVIIEKGKEFKNIVSAELDFYPTKLIIGRDKYDIDVSNNEKEKPNIELQFKEGLEYGYIYVEVRINSDFKTTFEMPKNILKNKGGK